MLTIQHSHILKQSNISKPDIKIWYVNYNKLPKASYILLILIKLYHVTATDVYLQIFHSFF